MTHEECQQALAAVRRQQGTRCPLIRVDAGGQIFRGRLSRSDSDPERQAALVNSSGSLELVEPVSRKAQAVPIEKIRQDGIQSDVA